AHPCGEDHQEKDEPQEAEERAPLARAALLVERLERHLLENRALPLRSARIRHRDFNSLSMAGPGSSSRKTWPSRSRTCNRSSEAPRHGPATHLPVSGSKIAPCVEQTKYRPLSS